MLYKRIFNQKNNIINEIKPNYQIINNKVKFYVSLKYSSELYLYIDENMVNGLTDIKVNDEILYIPAIGDINYTNFHNVDNRGILTLGTYNGQVEI